MKKSDLPVYKDFVSLIKSIQSEDREERKMILTFHTKEGWDQFHKALLEEVERRFGKINNKKDMKFEVWIEGYAATGEHGSAEYYGTFEATTFVNACKMAMKQKGMDTDKYYDEVKNSYWGCRFFSNETNARKSFG